MAIVRQLARPTGVGIVYVSHRIREITRLADRVAVLRDGKLVAVRHVSRDQRGRAGPAHGRPAGGVVLRPRSPRHQRARAARSSGLTTDWLKNVVLTVHKRRGGGSGRSHRRGADRARPGPVRPGARHGRARSRSMARPSRCAAPARRWRPGSDFAPEDRKREGLFLPRNVRREHQRSACCRGCVGCASCVRAGERRVASRLIERLRIRTPSASAGGRASSRVATSRRSCSPGGSRGGPSCSSSMSRRAAIDVGAKAEIYDLIHELARGGHGDPVHLVRAARGAGRQRPHGRHAGRADHR